MDKNGKYFAMCADAKEIQDEKHKIGLDGQDSITVDVDGYIWLPRQDQLLEMVMQYRFNKKWDDAVGWVDIPQKES